MPNVVKFSGQIDAKVKKELDAFVKETGQTMTSIYTEMALQFLNSRRIRSDIMNKVDQVIREDEDLLRRLAK
jgi:hypothetical protein